MDVYTLVDAKANEIEAELRRLNRWGSEPLAPECFENMGAFGSNTMSFEQWIQFILIPRIKEITTSKGKLPENSSLSVYGVRAFDGDVEADNLNSLLYQLDDLINTPDIASDNKPEIVKPQESVEPPSLTYGSSTIPEVVYTLLEILPQFSGADLEAQLQTYDVFLNNLSKDVRLQLADLIERAASKSTDEVSQQRIQHAAKSIREGGRAAEPYNHEEAMKKYKEEHKKSSPKD